MLPSGKIPGPSRLRSKRAKMLVIVTLFLLIIGMGLVGWGGFEARRAAESRRWPSTRGTVIRAYIHEVEKHHEEQTDSTFYPRVLYRYFVLGELHTADRIAFGGLPGGSRASAQKVIDRYPVGMALTVYYAPNRPAVAVLEAGYSLMAYSMIGGGLIFLTAAAFGFRAWQRRLKKGNIH